ncbi:MAG: asparagine synthase (glutamine-hydrolyzing) [Deltaproteobacteria bacterium RBG_19FT_COMBO_60_16]|nr:MAG: asparagine synthase (glutamine-hydrolyzing) [Deltaproteobacteria bacterium RBG_19FT_COMBO_60_16]
MCGIAGYLCFEGRVAPSVDVLGDMVSSLRHRGPDASGVYLDDSVGLGHSRLSIVDLAGGDQPIHNEDESLWIVYNGEIFNYPELQKELAARGHRFYTSTDTEVILHLYEEEGAACLSRLNGQFALAIWDNRARSLFLARDRMGIRPLHYIVEKGRLLFASEIKALFQADDVPRRLDPVALDQVFTFWSPLPGRTIFQAVQELPPGHYLVATPEGGVSIRQYWDVPFGPPGEQSAWEPEELREHVRELLIDAVRIRLRADVPVGSYLSGGLDSSGVTAIVKRHFNNRLRTFGIRFEEPRFDESRFQDGMVSFLGTEHTAIRATNEEIGKAFRDVIRHVEKPILRTAPVPLYLLSDTVRRNGFKVVLTGEGADEVFGGYDIFRETLVRRFWARQPSSRLRPRLIRKLYPDIFRDPRLGATLQAFFGVGLQNTGDPFYSHRIRWENTKRIKTFFSEDLRGAIGDYSGEDELRARLPGSFASWDPLSKAQYLEMALFLSNYLLSSQGDRVAMAHSVEIRLPFLDYRIVEFMARVPPRWKIRGLREKYLLKRVLHDLLPAPILRRPKHPYRAPIGQSLLPGNGADLPEALTGDALKREGLFDAAKVGRLIRKIRTVPEPSEVDAMALAGILSSQLLHEQFVSRFPAGRGAPFVPTVFVDRRSIVPK